MGAYFCNSDWKVAPFKSLMVRATSSSTGPVDNPFGVVEAFADGESCKRR